MSVYDYSVFLLFCVRIKRDLATGSSPVQGALPTVYRIKKLINGQGPKNGCRVINR
jgi:hypothetical protein